MPEFKEVYNKNGIILVEGCCEDYLKTISDKSVSLLLSDPP